MTAACAEEVGRRASIAAAPTCAWKGPQFSTLAESNLYRSWGAHVIGMTNLQEAKLAREAEICYTTMALVTDYDCWHPDHDSVTVELIIQNLTQNAKTAQQVVAAAVEALCGPPGLPLRDARWPRPSSPGATPSRTRSSATSRRSSGSTCVSGVSG